MCINGLKPVSRFVADKKEHIEFLKIYLKKERLELESRELKKIESFKLLEKLLYGNKCYIKDNNIFIEGNNYQEKYEIKEYANIIKFK